MLSYFRALLRSTEIQRDPVQYEQVVQKVIAYMTLGVDMSPLFTEMIMVIIASYQLLQIGHDKSINSEMSEV